MFDHIDKEVAKAEQALAVAKIHRQQSQERLEQARNDLETCKAAQGIAQGVAKAVQEQAHRRIADVVSRCLSAVFDEPYEFRLVFEEKRGRTEASLVFVREGMEVDPMSAAGGGVVDVAAFALRLSCLLLSRPPLRRVLVLDEPFKFVSAEYRSRLRILLETLSKEMGVQFLMVTHIPELKVGRVIELGE